MSQSETQTGQIRDVDVREIVDETREYYDGPADEIYRLLWGENVHMGWWVDADRGERNLREAMDRTNAEMTRRAGIPAGSRVLDVGCGYGAAARYLAREHDCEVVGQNISRKELEAAREQTAEAGLDDRVVFEYGDFHDIPAEDAGFDVVWSQEAFLHGADKHRILEECHRVLRPDGRLVVSDLLVRPDVPVDEREQLYARVHSPEMWDLDEYVSALTAAGFDVEVAEDWSDNVAPTYQAVLDGMRRRLDELRGRVPEEQLEDTVEALELWVDAARDDKIGQGFLVGIRT